MRIRLLRAGLGRRERRDGLTYAAVLAICPNRPGPCEAWGGAWAVGACCWGGAAMVVAGRCCWGAGAEGAVVGRAGARETGARPAERLRGILIVVCDREMGWRCLCC